MGLQGQALKDAINATQDLSTLMEGDIQSAVRVVADAFNGNVGMLQRYIKNLDESDIKQRGTISLIEHMNKAIGGQAEAFGTTDAGSIRKFDAAVADLKQSFGDLLKQAINPIINIFSKFLHFLNKLSDTTKIAVMGITSIGVAFAFLNMQFGKTPYILLGFATGITTFISAIKMVNQL